MTAKSIGISGVAADVVASPVLWRDKNLSVVLFGHHRVPPILIIGRGQGVPVWDPSLRSIGTKIYRSSIKDTATFPLY